MTNECVNVSYVCEGHVLLSVQMYSYTATVHVTMQLPCPDKRNFKYKLLPYNEKQ